MNETTSSSRTGESGREYDVRTSSKGIDYIRGVLMQKKTVSTQATFWKIPHDTGPGKISLRVGRYKRAAGQDVPAQTNPKSQLTLEGNELDALIDFIADNYKPLREGARRYMVLDQDSPQEQVEALKSVFANPDRQQLLEALVDNQVVPDDLRRMLEYRARCEAVDELEQMLQDDLREAPWQGWFERNDWVLGSEFVQLVGERAIDVDHIADYLMEAYDGFLDIVEIKRPEGQLRFWGEALDHGNPVPHSDLIKAVTQASRYLFEIEREAATLKFAERVRVPTIKPRCTLIFGRSIDWDSKQREAYRILNAGYHNLSILTYDHVLTRAKRMLAVNGGDMASESQAGSRCA